jgi:F-type H+-transporting ATPase subunit b
MHNAFLAAAAEEPHNPLIPAPADLIWATVAFAIILVFFIWKVVPRFTKLLDERSDAIEGGIKRAEEAQAAAEASKDEYEAQRAEVGSLALDLASNVIGETLNDDKKATALVDRFLADLEASETETKKA